MGVSSADSYEVLQQLTDELEKYRQDVLDKKKPPILENRLSPDERRSAIEYLTTPDLMKRSGEDLGKTGIIGEELNRLTMLIVMSSRKRPRPLHVMNMASSGQGKTHLLEGVSACIPEEDKIEMTSLSDNALYYFGEDELKHKLMLIEDLDGAGNVLYPLRELQSKRKLSKTVAIKDERGKTKTMNFEVNGPVCIAGCTTQEQLYEDNANRSFLLYLDESAEQDKRIMEYQRLKSAGKIKSSEEKSIQNLLRTTQRILRDISVRNPYAEFLKIPNAVFKPRRTNAHYLDFIEAVTFYHQFQREVKTDEVTGEKYIESTLEDIRWANKLLSPVLLRKSDELTGACRRFFEKLKIQLKILGQSNFRSNEMRIHFRIAYSTFKRHLLQLTQNGFLKIVGGNRYHRGFEYEITSYSEYEELQEEVSSVLNEVYKKIKDQ